MKKLAIIIAILSLLFTSCGGDNSPNIPEYVPSSSETVYITWDQAADYVGRVAQVCGPVMDTSWNELAEDSPTYLNMGKPYPEKGRFSVLIRSENRIHFPGRPEKFYLGKTICVTGVIQMNNGVPQIEIIDSSMLSRTN